MYIYGIKASKGYAIGHVYKLEHTEVKITDQSIEDVETEKQRLIKAVEKSKLQIITIQDRALREIGETESAVFDSHILFLEDPEFIEAAMLNISSQNISAEKAIYDITKTYLEIFEGIEDEYMRERAADIKDVSQRLINNLSGAKEKDLSTLPAGTIIVAHDLTPSDTAQLDRNKVIGFITNIGGKTSHSAIMARALEIPAVVGAINITDVVHNGDQIIIDGNQGLVIPNPSKEVIAEYEIKIKQFEIEKNSLTSFAKAEAITKQGKKIIVAGNIGSPKDVDNVKKNGGEGIGLYRTEFLFMDREEMPSEEEQFNAYGIVAERMGEMPIIIRTLDIGGDKKLSYLPLPKEENPFLGYRAIRICLDRKDLFKIQLRAILRASHFGNIQIMFPMISNIDEFLRAKELLHECMEELTKEGIPFNESIQVGIMIEIPAAALIADEFAKYVDFFSIGTNDLTQYTLAVDRMNEKISDLYNPMHPAVLKLIKLTIDAAHNAGKWCGMCGELAGDEDAIPLLLEYGLDEFSMTASSIPKAKQIIINS
jgi:phosphoenolpyruvate-protein phosphotransferase (PTS system enzyme I)